MKTKLLIWLLALTVILEIIVTVLIPNIRSGFYNALQAKDSVSFGWFLVGYSIMLCVITASAVAKPYLQQTLALYKQMKLMARFNVANLHGRKTDKTAQAATESAILCYRNYYEVYSEVVISAVIVVSLYVINYNQTSLILLASGYSIGAILVSFLFKKPLLGRELEVQTSTAKYRESISMHEVTRSKTRRYLTALYDMVKLNSAFILFKSSKNTLAAILPLAILAPQYFSGKFTLGEYMAQVATFELIVINFTILIIFYKNFLQARTSREIIEAELQRLSTK